MPDKANIQRIWDRRGAMQFQRNQKGSDFGLLVRHKREENKMGAILVQVQCDITCKWCRATQRKTCNLYLGQELFHETERN